MKVFNFSLLMATSCLVWQTTSNASTLDEITTPYEDRKIIISKFKTNEELLSSRIHGNIVKTDNKIREIKINFNKNQISSSFARRNSKNIYTSKNTIALKAFRGLKKVAENKYEYMVNNVIYEEKNEFDEAITRDSLYHNIGIVPNTDNEIEEIKIDLKQLGRQNNRSICVKNKNRELLLDCSSKISELEQLGTFFDEQNRMDLNKLLKAGLYVTTKSLQCSISTLSKDKRSSLLSDQNLNYLTAKLNQAAGDSFRTIHKREPNSNIHINRWNRLINQWDKVNASASDLFYLVYKHNFLLVQESKKKLLEQCNKYMKDIQKNRQVQESYMNSLVQRFNKAKLRLLSLEDIVNQVKKIKNNLFSTKRKCIENDIMAISGNKTLALLLQYHGPKIRIGSIQKIDAQKYSTAKKIAHNVFDTSFGDVTTTASLAKKVYRKKIVKSAYAYKKRLRL